MNNYLIKYVNIFKKKIEYENDYEIIILLRICGCMFYLKHCLVLDHKNVNLIIWMYVFNIIQFIFTSTNGQNIAYVIF